jgi:hypothetical protein
LAQFGQAGIDLNALATRLQDEGAGSFVKSWNELMAVIVSKSAALQKTGSHWPETKKYEKWRHLSNQSLHARFGKHSKPITGKYGHCISESSSPMIQNGASASRPRR